MKKKQSPLRKHLTAIARAVHSYVDNCAYYYSYDGGQEHVARFEKNRWRKKGRITRACNSAHRQAQAMHSAELVEAIEAIKSLAREVVYQCRWFPNNDISASDWPGLLPLKQFDAAITRVRAVALSVRAPA